MIALHVWWGLIVGIGAILARWLARFTPRLHLRLSGSAAGISAIISGVLVLVVGLVLASTIGAAVELVPVVEEGAIVDEFAGARAIGDLIPIIYIAAILMMGIGLIVMGGMGVIGSGPMAPTYEKPQNNERRKELERVSRD